MRGDLPTILYLAPWVTLGGADRGTVDWFRTVGSTHATYLVTTQESCNERFEDVRAHATAAWALPDLMSGAGMPRFIAELIATREVQVLHIMNSRLGFDLAHDLKRAFPRLRVVAQLHAEEGEGQGYPPYVAARWGNEIDAYSLVSHELAAIMAGYGVDSEKLHVIPLGVDTEAFNPATVEPVAAGVAPAELNVLFPARLTLQKDPELMLSVAGAARDAGVGVRVHVVGSGDLEHALRAGVDAHNLHDTVRLHGAQTDVAPWYAATDVTLLTSRFEGIPLTVYEAMAMAKPVVAAAVGATGELLDESSGFLIDPRDDVEAYVNALRTLAANPALRKTMGDAGRRRVFAGFTVRDMADGHEQLYRSLTAGAALPAGHVDLDRFDGWTSHGSAGLYLARRGPTALVVESESEQRSARGVLLGRVFTSAFPGTTPIWWDGAAYRSSTPPLGAVVGHGLAYPLPGMIELGATLAVHRRGALAGFDHPVWIDSPQLEPMKPAPRSGRQRRVWRRG